MDRSNQLNQIDQQINKLAKKAKVIFSDERYLPDLPVDLSFGLISRHLSELPALIGYVGSLIAEVDEIIRNLRAMADQLKEEIDLKKAAVRLRILDEYKSDLETHRKELERLLSSGGAAPRWLQDQLRQRPVKPTADELADRAKIETADLLKDLNALTQSMNRIIAIRDRLAVRKEALENKFLSVRAHRNSLQEQMRNNL